MQQIPFIDLFKSALHVSGDKLAHPQEQFLTVYTAFGTMHRGGLKRSINGICCIFLVAYIVVLMMDGLTIVTLNLDEHSKTFLMLLLLLLLSVSCVLLSFCQFQYINET